MTVTIHLVRLEKFSASDCIQSITQFFKAGLIFQIYWASNAVHRIHNYIYIFLPIINLNIFSYMAFFLWIGNLFHIYMVPSTVQGSRDLNMTKVMFLILDPDPETLNTMQGLRKEFL